MVTFLHFVTSRDNFFRSSSVSTQMSINHERGETDRDAAYRRQRQLNRSEIVSINSSPFFLHDIDETKKALARLQLERAEAQYQGPELKGPGLKVGHVINKTVA